MITLEEVIDWLKDQNEEDCKLIDRWDHDAGRRYWLRKDIIDMLEGIEPNG